MNTECIYEHSVFMNTVYLWTLSLFMNIECIYEHRVYLWTHLNLLDGWAYITSHVFS